MAPNKGHCLKPVPLSSDPQLCLRSRHKLCSVPLSGGSTYVLSQVCFLSMRLWGDATDTFLLEFQNSFSLPVLLMKKPSTEQMYKISCLCQAAQVLLQSWLTPEPYSVKFTAAKSRYGS